MINPTNCSLIKYSCMFCVLIALVLNSRKRCPTAITLLMHAIWKFIFQFSIRRKQSIFRKVNPTHLSQQDRASNIDLFCTNEEHGFFKVMLIILYCRIMTMKILKLTQKIPNESINRIKRWSNWRNKQIIKFALAHALQENGFTNNMLQAESSHQAHDWKHV